MKIFLKKGEYEADIKEVQFPCFNIGMEAPLWALTYYVISQVFKLVEDEEIGEDHGKLSKFHKHIETVLTFDKNGKTSYHSLFPLGNAFYEFRFLSLKPSL